ncbi:MAG: putative colanic acid biosynthesis acetyltransferase [Planctomycetota bacterium]
MTDLRHVSPYSFRQKVGRVLWGATQGTLFRWSWPTWFGYRNALLRCFGATVDPTARPRRLARVTCPWNLTIGPNTALGDDCHLYCLGPVVLGARVTISQNAHLCAGSHDYGDPALMPLLREPITVHDDAWVAADAFVGPGVTVGQGALLGARGCAFRDLEPWTIYGGNPAKAIKPREVQATDDANAAPTAAPETEGGGGG